MTCTSCGYSLKSKSLLTDFPSYSVPKEGALSLESIVIASSSRGWSSHAWHGLLGKSETTHEFTIVISRCKNEANFLAIEIATSIGKVSEATLLTFFAKAFDVGVREKILVAIPKLDEGAKKFADSYGITLIESPSPSLALEAIAHRISEMSELGAQKRVMAKKEKRTSFDIIADILTTASKPISKTEILFRANLSFKQAQKYLKMLEKMALLRCFDEGSGRRYVTTQKGAEYLADSLCDFGRISEGSNSVWSSKQENP
jgi:predicted transcriptional regulator